MQTKTFPITNAMRERVARQLTLQAVAQHGPRIAADLEALNRQFWAAHIARVEALPGLDRKHWADLILAGAVTATASCQITYKKQRDEDRYPVSTPFIAAQRKYNNDDYNSLLACILASAAFEGVNRLLELDRHGGQSVLTIHLIHTHGVPRLIGMQSITDPGLETLASLICGDLNNVIQSAYAFHQQALDVLAACRTSRQVEDLFPEAAKLLPQPAKQTKTLAPTELADSVRAMLKQGVPPVTA